jgi:hypothetical protein
MEDGRRYSTSPNAGGGAAWHAAAKHAPDKTEKQARDMTKAWQKSGTLYPENYDDPVARKPFQGLRVNAAKRAVVSCAVRRFLTAF